MGCDIHSMAIDSHGKPISEGCWSDRMPFGWRSYSVFAFLAGVRNYSEVKPISKPRGLPDDLRYDYDMEWLGDHSFSWLKVSELAEFDYDAKMECRRYAESDEPGEVMTYMEFLGDDFFGDLEELRRIGAHRVVFGFDS